MGRIEGRRQLAYLESPVFDARTKWMSGATSGRGDDAFRLAMREFANGVALVTTGHGEQRSGCTATSFCSLSLDPPSLIVCVSRDSSTLALLRTVNAFGVSILAGAHEHLADRFAGRGGLKGAARFAGSDWMTLVTGAPLLRDALAGMDCTVEEVLDRHTHAIVIGRVAAVHRDGQGPALIHWRSRFQQLDRD
jgi:flavin reductase (DIM6/NTAB) family NADH-FMN oxidoreductase RutF